ncbi:MAG: virulence factor SrfB [Muribaculaceae bacterium]|nr:virulence factor SrfB [Muribaculaceae bacterium]
MELSLIANSGIQLFTRRVEIDLNEGAKQLFYESFDDEVFQWKLEYATRLRQVGKLVLTAQLKEKGYMDASGRLLTSEELIVSNPEVLVFEEEPDEEEEDMGGGFFTAKVATSNKFLEPYFNKWLPAPFIEKDVVGDYRNGPYNWCKCKIIPIKEKAGVITADVLFAVDTRSVYNDEDLYQETPVFVSNGERDKRFTLCDNEQQLIDFCMWNDAWVRDYLMRIAFPGVTEFDMLEVREGQHRYMFLASYLILMAYLGGKEEIPTIKLVRDRGVEHVKVDMIIDIGNSRTGAILMENQDFTKVTPLRLQDFTHPITPDGQLNRKEDTFDMRLAFRRVSFGPNIENSNQFVWPSFIRLGKEAQYLSHQVTALQEGQETVSTYSSPKRYLWDNKPVKQEWRLVNVDGEDANEPPIIPGVSNYFNYDGTINEEGFGVGASYSRRTLMTFAFMEILQQAIVQINSYEHRNHRGRMNTPRSIEKVIITSPTAMSLLEQQALCKALKDAVFVLNHFNSIADESARQLEIEVVPNERFDRDGNRLWSFDEATCSQLVFVYGQLCDRYKNCSAKFFELYGKKREIEGVVKDTINIGTVDIGAGTTDLSICRYEYNATNQARVKPIPIFWDSFGSAGDDMLQVLITNVLIEGDDAILYKHMMEMGMSRQEIYKKLYRFFGEDHNAMSFKDRLVRRDFNIQVNVPVMYYYLNLLSHGEKYRELSYKEIFENNLPSEAVLKAFEEKMGFSLCDVKWIYDSEIMSRYVERSMDKLVEAVATLLYAYDCDIVLLSGRPTTLEPLRRCFLKYFAVSPNRLVVMGKYRIGRWYPFCDESGGGFVKDTKSLVPVGAMIGYLASRAGGLDGFSVDLSELGNRLVPTTDYFLKMNANVQEPCFISPTCNRGSVHVPSFPVYIGSKQHDIKMYPLRPFYVLDINEDRINEKLQKGGQLSKYELQQRYNAYRDTLLGKGPFVFEIEREDCEENKEKLTIESVKSDTDEEVSRDDFSLIIQSLNDPECYWLDSGEFPLNIAATEL